MVFEDLFRFFQEILPHEGFREIGGSLCEVRLMEFDAFAVVSEEIGGDIEDAVAHGLDALCEILLGDVLLSRGLFKAEDGGLFAGLLGSLLGG